MRHPREYPDASEPKQATRKRDGHFVPVPADWPLDCHIRLLLEPEPKPLTTVPDAFQPAFYTGEGRDSYWHADEACPTLAGPRERGTLRRSRVGAMQASGKKPCTTCTDLSDSSVRVSEPDPPIAPTASSSSSSA